MPSRIQEQRVECIGGLETTRNNLLMSQVAPGTASVLTNYEVSPAGGYARVLGYEKFNSSNPEPGVGVCEGAVLGIMVYIDINNEAHFYAVRKNTSGTTYSMWKYDAGNPWTQVTLPTTRNTSQSGRNVVRLRWRQYNDGSNNYLVIVDGVNEPLIYDGTTWREMIPGNTGTNASPGGDQLIDYPNYISIFKRHLFLARSDNGQQAIVCHSAPDKPFDFAAANGGGQILPSFDVENIKPFREDLYVFGSDRIGAVELSGSTFTYKDVVDGIGLVAPDTVQELGSSLVFLSQDGFRPIAATERIGDVEIVSVTEPVRNLLESIVNVYDKNSINTIHLKRKNQVRMSYGGTAAGTSATDEGFLLSTRTPRGGGFQFESSQLLGMTFWCGTSIVVNNGEVTLHGGLDGTVYKQEVGNTFDGSAIFSSFSPPYLDQGSTVYRKSYKFIQYFIRLDFEVGSSTDTTFFISEKLDWDDANITLPSDFEKEVSEGNIEYDAGQLYDGGAKYGGSNGALIEVNIEGSGKSIKPGLVTTGITPRHVVFGFVIGYIPEGVK